MEFLYFLENLRTPFLDSLMSAVTLLGDETFFLVTALYIFWCCDKNRGYLVMSVGFVGTVINQFLKLACRVPRPWVIDENFTIVESAREGATGYSFPSGHTQNAVGTFGTIAVTSKKRWVRCLCAALIILVPFSRMYLGVHTPADVAVSFAIAIFLIAVLVPLFEFLKKQPERFMLFLGFMFILGALYFIYAEFYPFPSGIDAANLASGRKNACSLLGALLGILIAYPLERKYIGFSEQARPLSQVLKLAAGLAVTLIIKSGIKFVFSLVFGPDIYLLDVIRYCVVVIFVVLVWPMTFPFWRCIGEK